MGGAVGDIVLNIPKLPKSGEDCLAEEGERQIGGCGLNVARALRRLDFQPIAAISVGNGPWGELVKEEMDKENISSGLMDEEYDNGWCMALVEADGERTFISVEGCETYWDEKKLQSLQFNDNALIYVSGYELCGENAKALRNWILSLPETHQILVDLGPRIKDIENQFFEDLLKKNIILTLNQDEAEYLLKAKSNLEAFINFSKKHEISIIYRQGEKGTYICEGGDKVEFVAPYKVKAIDTVGAGDTHCAGVLAGLSLGLFLKEATDLGNKLASVIVMRQGANNPPYRHELKDISFF